MRYELLFILLSALAGPASASGYGPFIPYNIERSPAEAVREVRSGPHAQVFLRELAKNAGLSEADMASALDKGEFELRPCPHCKVQFAGVSKAGDVHYVWRPVKQREKLACVAGACFSTDCGNPLVGLEVPVSSVVCKEGPVTYTQGSFYTPGAGWIPYAIGGTGFGWTHSSHPVECVIRIQRNTTTEESK